MIKKNANDIEYIYNEGELICTILRKDFRNDKINFFTPDTLSQQLGYLPHKKGDIIKAHKHKINKREVLYTQEVLFIKKGKVKVNLYDNRNIFIGSVILENNDIILLCSGGHGFEILEDTAIIEVKHGPYVGVDDKERFEGVEGKNDCR